MDANKVVKNVLDRVKNLYADNKKKTKKSQDRKPKSRKQRK